MHSFPHIPRPRLLVLFLLIWCLSLFLSACGEQEKVYSVGIFLDRPPELVNFDGLKDGLKTLGYVEGKNVNYYSLNSTGMSEEQQKSVLKEFAAKNYDLYWALSGSGGLSLKQVTKQPIVIAGVSNAIQRGLAQSLERPGGNVTGIDSYNNELSPKRLGWLLKLDPTIKKVYFLYSSGNNTEAGQVDLIKAEAQRSGITLVDKTVASKEEAQKVVLTFKASEAQAIVTIGNEKISWATKELKTVVEREKLILIGGDRAHFDYGALLSYGPSYYSLAKQSSGYVDKVLHGSDPATMPIIPPTKVELYLNQKLADQLGVKFPEALLSAADEIVK